MWTGTIQSNYDAIQFNECIFNQKCFHYFNSTYRDTDNPLHREDLKAQMKFLYWNLNKNNLIPSKQQRGCGSALHTNCSPVFLPRKKKKKRDEVTVRTLQPFPLFSHPASEMVTQQTIRQHFNPSVTKPPVHPSKLHGTADGNGYLG